jgi:hypothetical protein
MRVVAIAGLGILGTLIGCPQQHEQPTSPIGGLEPLSADKGFSYYIPPFEVPPGVEVQDCYFFEVPDLNNGEDVWIDRFQIGQRTGTHHMNVFRVNTIVNLQGQAGDVVRGGECRLSKNWVDWPLVVNSQEATVEKPVVDWQLPNGVAQRFRPGELLMAQTHYVNADLQETPDGGEVLINFHRADEPEPIEMGTLFATQQAIRICEHGPQVQSYSGACSFPNSEEIHVAAANGHFHGRGVGFSMYAWDGQSLDHPGDDAMFYSSTQWDEPDMAIDLDAVIPAGGGIWWTCDYTWREPSVGCDVVNGRDPTGAGDCCYTFGNSAEEAEHCNVFAYYWPKVESNVFCN